MASLLVTIPLIIVDAVVYLAAIFWTLILIPINIAVFLYAIGASAFNATWAFVQNYQAVFITLGVLLFIFVLGPYGRDNPTYVIEAINSTNECIIRPFYEVVNKVPMTNIKSLYIFASQFYNKALRELFYRFKVTYYDLTTVIDCIFQDYNIGDLLTIPSVIWTRLIYPSFYIFTTSPLFNKQEIFQPGQHGYWYPKDNSNPTLVIFNNTQNTPFPPSSIPFVNGNNPRYEFDPNFGAQGPPPNFDLFQAIVFPLHDFYIQTVEIIGDTGDFVTLSISNLGRPGQKFFPSLIIDVNEPGSFWGTLADLICRYSELVIFTFVWPPQPLTNGQQPLRHSYEAFACRSLRIIACFIRFGFLVFNDATTVARPIPNAPPGICPPQVSAEQYLIELLQGVPVVDLFLSTADGATNLNLNIFTSSLPWCLFGKATNDYILRVDSVDAAITFGCTGLIRGSLPVTEACDVWPGISAPLSNERIDYFGEFLDCFKQLVLLVVDPFNYSPLELCIAPIQDRCPCNGQTISIYDCTYSNMFSLVGEYFNVLLLDAIYFLDATANCGPFVAPAVAVVYTELFLEQLLDDTINTVYWTDQCNFGLNGNYINQEGVFNPFFCLISLGSRANQTMFEAICNAYDDVQWAVGQPEISCAHGDGIGLFRKRFAADHFATKSEPKKIGLLQELKLHASKYAFYGKDVLVAVDSCRTLGACNSTCAAAPCMPALMDCVQEKLDDDNSWKELLDRSNSRSVYVRNGLIAAAVASDVLAGCNDAAMNMWFSAFGGMVDLMRDFAVRYMVVAHKQVPTYERCNRRAHEAALRGESMHNITLDFLLCIGLKPTNETITSTANNRTREMWSDTLQKSGIPRNDTDSFCSYVLHQNGFLIDELENRTVTAEHTVYKLCVGLLAFGSNAVHANETRMALKDFTNLYTAPFAIFQSTSEINAQNYPEKIANLLLPSSQALRRALPFETRAIGDGGGSSNSTSKNNKTSSIDDIVETFHPYIGVLVAYVNYLADLYKHAMNVPTTGVHKDGVDRELYARFVGVVGGMKTFGKRAASEFVRNRRKRAPPPPRGGGARNWNTTELSIPFSATRNNNDFTLLTKSFHWVFDISNAVQPSVSYISQSMNTDGRFMPAKAKQHGSTVEAYIDLQFRVRINSDAIIFGLRRVDDLLSTHTFGHLRTGLNVSAKEQGKYSIGDLRPIVDALDFYSQQLSTPPAARQQAAQAVADFNVADQLMRAVTMYDKVGKRISDARVVHGFRTVLKIVWGLIYPRILPEALPPYQAATVAIDVLTSGDTVSFQEYLNGTLGYIPGIGYVSIESYDKYMAMQNAERAQFLGAYTAAVPEDIDHEMYVYSARRNARAKVEDLKNQQQQQQPAELGGSTSHQRWVQSKVAALHGEANFRHRTGLLRKHRLLQHDNMMHHAAGKHWEHYELALSVSDKPKQRLELALISAPANTAEFWIELGDAVLQLFTGRPMLVTNAIDSFENLLNTIAGFLFTDAYGNWKKLGTSFIANAECHFQDSYALAGTDVYRSGCIPFAPERAANWIVPFPNTATPTRNILDLFKGPGDIAWPDDMLAPGGDCPTKRIPICVGVTANQCPLSGECTIEVATIFQGGISTYFNRLCITNACLDPTVYTLGTAGSRPLCPVCDYCIRHWKSAVDFGFTDGWINLQQYDIIIRYIITNAYTTYDALIFVVLGFAFFKLRQVLVLISPLITYLVLAFALWFELFMNERFDRLLTILLFYTMTAILPIIGYSTFAFYIVALFGPSFHITTAPPAFMTSIVNFILDNLLPGPILRVLVMIARLVVTAVGVVVPSLKVEAAYFLAIEQGFVAAKTAVPTFSSAFYGIISFYNVVQLVITATPFAAAISLASVIAVITIAGLVGACAYFCSCCGLCLTLYNSLSIIGVQNDAADTDSRLLELENLYDQSALTVGASAAATTRIGARSAAGDDFGDVEKPRKRKVK